MNPLNYSRLSKTPPLPYVTNHGSGGVVGYNCHSAVLHWAFMNHGDPQNKANQRVQAITLATCRGCTENTGNCSSLLGSEYGKMFCQGATLVRNPGELYGVARVGDVLITGHPTSPQHSMVVRQRRHDNHLTVRGFNNKGTLDTGIKDMYDPVSHNIFQDKYWKANNKFGSVNAMSTEDLFVVPYNSFMAKVQYAMQVFK